MDLRICRQVSHQFALIKYGPEHMEKKPLRSSEEIDLLYYLNETVEGIKKLGRLTKKYLQLIWKKKLVFFLIIILGTGSAYSLRYIIPPAYRTDGFFVSHFLPASYYAIMVDDLNKLLVQDLPIVAEQLHLDPKVASQIKRIQLEPWGDPIERNDTVFAPFRITLLLKETVQLDSIQEGFLLYLGGGEKERKRKLDWSRSLQEERKYVYEHLSQVDSHRKKPNNISGKDSVVLYDDTEGKPEMWSLQELARVNRMLEKLDRVEVVRPFLKRSAYNYPNYRAYLIKGFLLSIIIAMIVTPFLANGIALPVNKAGD